MRVFWALALLASSLDAAVASFKPGEALIVFEASMRSGPKADPRDELHQRLGTQRLARLEAIYVDLVKFPPGADEEALMAAYAASPGVRRAERNYYVQKYSPTDAGFAAQQDWYDRIGATAAYDSYYSPSPAFALNSQITLAVLDTGVDSHSQISANLLPGASFVTGEPTTDDIEGHGTFVSGVIASATSVSPPADPGIAGVFLDSSKIRILPVKVLPAAGEGVISEVSAGVIYAADQGARVLNMSLGLHFDSLSLEGAVNYARAKGCFIVAATGNEDSSVSYPAAYPNVFSVGALDHLDNKTFYSNYGRVDLAAPGGDGINFASACPGLATPAGFPFEIWSLCNNSSTYTYGAGTSFSTPMAAATAAMLLSQDSARGPSDLHRILTQSADPLMGGYNSRTGWGRLNVYKALTYGNGPSSLPGSTLKIYNWPNPFDPNREGFTHISFFMERPADAKIRILDLAGDLVWEKKFSPGQTFAGMNLATWDGKNGAGQLVANGAYFMVLEALGAVAKNRVAVLR